MRRVNGYFVFVLLLVSVFQAPLFAQRPMNEADIQAETSYFSLDNGFKGKGGDLLNKEIGRSQFISFGELHNSRQMALFFNELLYESQKLGFDKLALEVGPNAADILSELSDSPEETAGKLKAFHKQYGSTRFSWPIPFFKGVEDARFLQTSREYGMELWGIDQEYTLGAPPLFDAMLNSVENPQKGLIKARDEATKTWKKLKKKTRNCEARNAPKIKAYFSLFESANEKAQSIISALTTSWDIYCHHHRGEYDQNNTKRIAYMRNNISRHIEAALKAEGRLPKVIAKMGSYHTGRVKSPLGYEDVGHLLAQLAAQYEVNSLHIRYMRRFWQGKDRIDSKDYADSRLFMTVGRQDEWAVIDLRPLREKIRKGELTATNWQLFEIFNYDLMLMAPADEWVTDNF